MLSRRLVVVTDTCTRACVARRAPSPWGSRAPNSFSLASNSFVVEWGLTVRTGVPRLPRGVLNTEGGTLEPRRRVCTAEEELLNSDATEADVGLCSGVVHGQLIMLSSYFPKASLDPLHRSIPLLLVVMRG